MSIMPEERLERIRTLLSTFQHLSTSHIASDLGVSRETVRRDVLKLEEQGYLRRVFGGVSLAELKAEEPIETRAQTKLKEKQKIARAAVNLLSAGQTLFIDAGSTISAFADELASLAGLTIITNSFDVALRLTSVNRPHVDGHEIIVLGGNPNHSLKATYGATTINQIFLYKADFAFLSPVGLTHTDGASSYYRAEAEVARAMCMQARKVVILADHSKLGQTSLVKFCDVQQIDTLVTDAKSQSRPDFASFDKALDCIVA